MKCIRFSKFRGQGKCHLQRQYIENITADSDASSPEKDHQEMGHKMKHGHFTKKRMDHFLRRRRFGHGDHKNRSHHDMWHGSLKKHRMNSGHKMGHHGMKHGYHMHHGMEHDHHMHHGMDRDHHMHHGMERGHHGMRHGHHMHRRMKYGFGKLHSMKHGHKKLHKMTRFFKHHRMEHKLNHAMEQKMKKHGQSNAEHNENDKHHQMDEVQEMYPGKARKESKNVCKCPEECNFVTEEIRTYPSKSDAQVSTENDRFQVCLNTSSYQPEEICVKIIDGEIDVSAIHECVNDDIYEFHEMYRTFTIPENVDPENLSSRLESDGKLIIEAPITSTSERELPNEREIPVAMQNDE